MMKWCLHGLCTFPNMVAKTLQPENQKEMYDQKFKKYNIMMILCVRVHAMGCWEVGHMTNFQKQNKTDITALQCSFLNQLLRETQKAEKIGVFASISGKQMASDIL